MKIIQCHEYLFDNCIFWHACHSAIECQHIYVWLHAWGYSTDFTKSYIITGARFNFENTFQEPKEHFIDIAIRARWHAPYITAI